MTKHRWITGAIALLLPGIIGISVYSAQRHAWKETYNRACEATVQNPVSQDYLRMYEAWSRLPAAEKGENPWGQGQYGGPEIQKKLREGQMDRLTADLPDLKNMVSHFPRELAEVIYGPNWGQHLEEYRQDCNHAESLLIGSTFFLACGAIVIAGGLLRSVLSRFLTGKQVVTPAQQADTAARPDETAKPEDTAETKNIAAVLAPAGATAAEKPKKHDKHKNAGKQEGYFQKRKEQETAPSPAAAQIAKPSIIEQFSTAGKEPAARSSIKDDYFGWAVELEEKPELKTLMTSEPLTRELSDLTEEVSAIRHFAAQQQDQMRKLQDGYDWMIVRRFCLRIIRCIDNIEDRIARLGKEEQILSDHLQDIKDELVFALESSGVEQYEPELEVSYKGLERYAEAIKDRVSTDDAARAGCIAEVARSGYQYLVNDDDVKIVRCAQVKLYELSQNQ